MKFFFVLILFKTVKSLNVHKFKYKSLNFKEMNFAIDESLKLYEKNVPRKREEQTKNEKIIDKLYEIQQSKLFLVNNVENKYARYLALYNTTNIDTSVEDWDFSLSPEVYAFIRIIPVVKVMSLEVILPNYSIDFEQKNFETKDLKQILLVAKEYLDELSKESDTTFDYHGLKYFSKGKYFIEFSFL